MNTVESIIEETNLTGMAGLVFRDLVSRAAELLGPMSDDPGIDPEYRRALVEMILRQSTLNLDWDEAVGEAIDNERPVGYYKEEAQGRVTLVLHISTDVVFSPIERKDRLTKKDAVEAAIGSIPQDAYDALKGVGFEVTILKTGRVTGWEAWDA